MSNFPRGAAPSRQPTARRLPADARRPPARVGSPGFAAVLSGLLPGLGQIYEDRWVKGILMIILPVFAITLGGAFVAYADPLTAFVLQHAPLVTFVLVGSVLVFHLYVVADAFAGRLRKLRGRMAVEYAVLALVTLALIAGYGTIYRQSAPWASLAARMFAPFATKAVAPPTAPEQEAPSWSGNDRLNILVMGVDTRETDPATRNTDTMLVLSLDPVNKTAAMLSIPRDVYIDKPGTFQGKINSAYAFGGPNLARRLVDDLLGIRIHTYVLVNFEAFNKIVDGVGGVVVDAKRPVRDEYYPTPDYGIERVNIVTGPQLMHGDLALKYARSRHDTNDYSRARRQQEVIGALRTRLTQADALRTLPSLIDTVGTTLETDFDPAKVRDFAAQLFYDPRIRQEGAHVEIENSGARAGAAKDVADRLALRAYGIVGVTNGSTARSVILVRNTSKRYTAEQLRQALGGIPMETSGDGSGGPDIVVRIGSDFKGFATDASVPATK